METKQEKVEPGRIIHVRMEVDEVYANGYVVIPVDNTTGFMSPRVFVKFEDVIFAEPRKEPEDGTVVILNSGVLLQRVEESWYRPGISAGVSWESIEPKVKKVIDANELR